MTGVAAILGKKLGMTQVFDEDGTVIPVTVIEAGPHTVTAVRSPERDGYAAVQLAFDAVAERKLTKAELGHLKKADAPPEAACSSSAIPRRRVADRRGRDRRVSSSPATRGQGLRRSAIGKGFQGTIKRHNFSRGPVTHGSHNVRAPGSIGASADPARVFKGMRMPGRMGGERVTQRGLDGHRDRRRAATCC